MKDPRKLWEILIGLDEPFVIATVCNTKTSSERMEGEVFGMTYAGKFYGEAEGEFRRFLEANMTKAMKTSMSFMETYIEHRSVAALWGATCGERTSVFFITLARHRRYTSLVPESYQKGLQKYL